MNENTQSIVILFWEWHMAVLVPGRSDNLSLSGVALVSPFREKSSKLRDNMMSPAAL